MIYFLACVLAILSGLTFAMTAPLYDVSHSDAWLGSALMFGLIASSLPVLKPGRSLRDAMIAIALFAAYTAAVVSIRNEVRSGRTSRHPLHVRYF